METFNTWILEEFPFVLSTEKLYISKFSIYDVSFEFIKNDVGIISGLKIQSKENFDDKYIPIEKAFHEYNEEYYHRSVFRVGKITQDFFKGISREINEYCHPVFDGDDFTLKYTFEMEPQFIHGDYSKTVFPCFFDDKMFEHALQYISKEKDAFDIARLVIRDVQYYNDIGKYEMSILNQAILIEMLVKNRLSQYLDENDDTKFKDENIQSKLKDKYGSRPSFAVKYIVFGLQELEGLKLPDSFELEYIDLIYKIRNKIAHGISLYEIPIIKQNKISIENIRNYIHVCQNSCVELFNFLYDLSIKRV